MFIHLGNGVIVNAKDIVGIFDFENTTTSKDTRDFFFKKVKSGEIVYVDSELPKSYIVADDGKSKKIYVSSISGSTLTKRFKSERNGIINGRNK